MQAETSSSSSCSNSRVRSRSHSRLWIPIALLYFSHGGIEHASVEAFSQVPSVRCIGRSRCSSSSGSGASKVVLGVMMSPQSSQSDLLDDNDNNNQEEENRQNKRDIIRDSLRRLAQLSLEDYEWRNSIFKSNEADRKVEESLARMMGEDPAYMRPMDAAEQTIGPLGRAEKRAVEWLSRVIDEEGKRAKKIVNTDGQLVRPIDAGTEGEELGPLGMVEKAVVDFLQRLRQSEKERTRNGMFVRPKDVDESVRGPLGEFEFWVASAFRSLQESETLRAQQSKLRGGEIVRPIDVPGPLGEFEMAVIDIIRSEKRRAEEGKVRGQIALRPKDAKLVGRLGEVEFQAAEVVQRLTKEERERLKNIQKILAEKRPMETNRDSPLGVAETFVVNLLRGPFLIQKVFERVAELIRSEPLDDTSLSSIKDRDSSSSNNNNKN